MRSAVPETTGTATMTPREMAVKLIRGRASSTVERVVTRAPPPPANRPPVILPRAHPASQSPVMRQTIAEAFSPVERADRIKFATISSTQPRTAADVGSNAVPQTAQPPALRAARPSLAKSQAVPTRLTPTGKIATRSTSTAVKPTYKSTRTTVGDAQEKAGKTVLRFKPTPA